MGVLVTTTRGWALFDAQRGVCTAQDHDGAALGDFVGGRGDPLSEFVQDLADSRRDLASLRSALRTTSLVHLVQNAQRSGRVCTRVEALRDLSETRMLLDSLYSLDEQLAHGGLNFDGSGMLYSGWRSLDDEAVAFRAFPEANALRQRSYRAPFTPEPAHRSEVPGG